MPTVTEIGIEGQKLANTAIEPKSLSTKVNILIVVYVVILNGGDVKFIPDWFITINF